MIILFADTESSDFKQRRVIQIAWQKWDVENDLIDDLFESLIFPNSWCIPPKSEFHIEHGLTMEKCFRLGKRIEMVLPIFVKAWSESDALIFHNAPFDFGCIRMECERLGIDLPEVPVYCSMKLTKEICKAPNKSRTGFKNPSLVELHKHCFNKQFDNPHAAGGDVVALRNSVRFLIQSGQLPITALQPLL